MLIIWDFDGVICDSDDIWAENWCKLLKSEKDIEISEQEKRELLRKMNHKMSIEEIADVLDMDVSEVKDIIEEQYDTED